MRKHVYTFLAFALLAGCGGDDESEAPLVLPSNLEVTVDVSDDGSGQVAVAATAVNANYYNIFFGDEAGEVPVKVTDGNAGHTYAESGTYTIKVQAHATAAAFVTATREVTISLTVPGEFPATGYTTPLEYEGMTLVWNDEFEGTAVNTANWSFETGTGTNGWGNNELQYYRPDNTQVKDGLLVITAKKEAFGDREYTSSRMVTRDKKTFQYGRVDIRAVLPQGQGIWPALWMLGANYATVNWPACGEIDIMEMVGGEGREKTVHGTVHWDNAGAYASYGKSYSLSSGIFADEFHVFSIVWTPTAITWYVDDVQFNVIDITPGGLSEFRNTYFFIFNIAVGGNWPGSPNAATVFPQKMAVDYVRVFQEE